MLAWHLSSAVLPRPSSAAVLPIPSSHVHGQLPHSDWCDRLCAFQSVAAAGSAARPPRTSVLGWYTSPVVHPSRPVWLSSATAASAAAGLAGALPGSYRLRSTAIAASTAPVVEEWAKISGLDTVAAAGLAGALPGSYRLRSTGLTAIAASTAQAVEEWAKISG